MRGTHSNRPRSPRRVLRGETPLTPRVPTDLHATWEDAVEEWYGWPEDDAPSGRELFEAELYYDEWLYRYEDDLINEPFDDEPLEDDPYIWESRYYDRHYYEGLRYDSHWYDIDEPAWDLIVPEHDMEPDGSYWPYRELGYGANAERDQRRLEEDVAWAEYHTPTAHTSTTPPPPAWDPTHPLYGMHPRKT